MQAGGEPRGRWTWAVGQTASRRWHLDWQRGEGGCPLTGCLLIPGTVDGVLPASQAVCDEGR